MFEVNGRRAAIVGIGTSREFGFDLGASALTLQAQAFAAALADAGLDKDEVDGLATAHGAPTGVDYEEFVAAAGLDVRYVEQAWAHGRWATGLVAHAAMAVTVGAADVVAILNTVTTRRGYAKHVDGLGNERVDEGRRDTGGGHGEWSVHGLDSPGSATALVAQRYMDRYGATSDDLAAVCATYRSHARRNPMATMRDKPLTAEGYYDEPVIAGPLRRADFALLTEGSTCLIVASEERARDLARPPVLVGGFQSIQASRDGYVMFARPGLGAGYGRDFPIAPVEHDVYRMAGITAGDVDALYVYDSFSSNAWMVTERFGFCAEGEAPDFLRERSLLGADDLPLNTNGGMLCEGDYTGYGHQVEMVRQLRGEAGERQVPGAQVMQWATPWGDSLVLTA